MKDKTSVTSSLSNKQSLTDAQVNAGFGFNTILESPDLNGQLYDIDSQVNIITKELCNFLTDNGVTLNSNDNTQLKTLMTALFAAKQNTLTAGANITIDENGVISAAAGELPNIPLFFHTWFDFKPVNIGWVNASNYSWLYGSMYQVAYQTLVDQYTPTGTFVADTSYYNCEFSDGQVVITTVPSNSGTLQQLKDWCDANSYTYNAAASIDELECYKTVSSSSETVAGTTITYYRTFNDMKIVVGDTQIANAESIYNSTGVAWYYILDTVNQRFKLPRTIFAETGVRDTVGNYVEPALPNITGGYNTGDRRTHIVGTSGAFYMRQVESNTWAGTSSVSGNLQGVGFDASRSNSLYKNGASVQPPATQMYLYFYMGNFTQTAIENTAGLNASLFNDKADKDAVVLLTGNQTIDGQKTFNQIINSVAPVRTSYSTEVATTNFTHNLLASIFQLGDGVVNATLIYNGTMSGGSGQAINLPEPYTNYSAFAIVMANGSESGWDCHTLFIPVNDIIREWGLAGAYGRAYFMLCTYLGYYWNIRTDSSSTSLVWYSDNCTIHQVYGIKM